MEVCILMTGSLIKFIAVASIVVTNQLWLLLQKKYIDAYNKDMEEWKQAMLRFRWVELAHLCGTLGTFVSLIHVHMEEWHLDRRVSLMCNVQCCMLQTSASWGSGRHWRQQLWYVHVEAVRCCCAAKDHHHDADLHQREMRRGATERVKGQQGNIFITKALGKTHVSSNHCSFLDYLSQTGRTESLTKYIEVEAIIFSTSM